MLGSIAAGTTGVSGFLDGEDCRATMAALRNMGVAITESDTTHLVIEGVGLDGLDEPSLPLDLGNSGTAMRLFAGLLAGQPFSSELIGDESLSKRPMSRVIKPLTQLGAIIDSNDGLPPLAISGGQALQGTLYASPVASAQVKSAVLLAGLYAEGDVVIVEPAPTRDHSERMLRSMGVTVRSGETQISMLGGQQPLAIDIQVPGDLSSAAFIILAALLAENVEVVIRDVGVNPTRTGVLEIFRAMGADISIDNVRLFGEEPVADITARSSILRGIAVDPQLVSLAIDEFPILFIAAACAEGKTTFSNIGELRVKESDRISAMSRGLKALSASVEESADGAVVHGGKLYGGSVKSCGDHRVAMSFAVAATVAEWPVNIQDTDNVATSFPGFVDSMRSLGIAISEVDVSGEQ
jgi:3-phosphoshikimate 1-carboxyvinyltransferase